MRVTVNGLPCDRCGGAVRHTPMCGQGPREGATGKVFFFTQRETEQIHNRNLLDAVELYFNRKDATQLGGFLTDLLMGNLQACVSNCADPEDLKRINRALYQRAPCAAYGSKLKFYQWVGWPLDRGTSTEMEIDPEHFGYLETYALTQEIDLKNAVNQLLAKGIAADHAARQERTRGAGAAAQREGSDEGD